MSNNHNAVRKTLPLMIHDSRPETSLPASLPAGSARGLVNISDHLG